MPHITVPHHESLASQLPAEVYHHLVRTLLLALPRPLTNSPEDLACRNHTAIAQIAALCLTNAAEANQAALYVAASEQSMQCLRLAEESDPTMYWAQKWRAQANAMLRHSQSALRLLQRMQATRQKLEANPEACDRAAWTEHCALNLMAEALFPPTPEPQPEPVASAPSACGSGLGEGAGPMMHDTPTHDTPVSPRRAAMINVVELVPGPLRGDLLQATALTPPLAAPDRQFAKASTA